MHKPSRIKNVRQKRIRYWILVSLCLFTALTGLTVWLYQTPDSVWRNQGEIEGITNIHSRQNRPAKESILFQAVEVESGIVFHHFPFSRSSVIVEDMGSGVAWGDYDNDEDLDLYVTNYGKNFLFRNNGDGTFTEAAEQAGVNDRRFGTGCLWGDFNRDGWIDLYVCNYIEYVYRESDLDRKAQFKRVEYPYTLNPSSYRPQPNCLYQNNGDGTFTDVAESLNVHNPEGRSLSGAWADFDLDGHLDLYVANDVSNNAFYRNKGDGTFEDLSSSTLTADYRGAMGIALGDFNRDGSLDMFITHWLAQENALYRNMFTFMAGGSEPSPQLFFTDSADEFGLGQISLDMVGWSTSFVDFDNDGLLDLWVSNGNTLEQSNNSKHLIPQPLHLFRQENDRNFIEVGKYACQELKEPMVSRGGAYADYNSDGRMDLAIHRHGSNLLLLKNTIGNANNWLRLRLKQSAKNTQALGARIVLKTNDGTQTQQIGSQGSYLSQNQNALHFGLGNNTKVEKIDIFWPDGSRQQLTNIDDLNQEIEVIHHPTY